MEQVKTVGSLGIEGKNMQQKFRIFLHEKLSSTSAFTILLLWLDIFFVILLVRLELKRTSTAAQGQVG